MASKIELLKELQNISEEVQRRKEEIELILKVIEELEKKYFELVEEIKKN